MRTKRREQQEVLRDMFCSLALCNNVTPVQAVQDAADNVEDQRQSLGLPDKGVGRRLSMVEYAAEKEPQLEASSPDEVALVKFGYLVRMKLIERDRTMCTM